MLWHHQTQILSISFHIWTAWDWGGHRLQQFLQFLRHFNSKKHEHLENVIMKLLEPLTIKAVVESVHERTELKCSCQNKAIFQGFVFVTPQFDVFHIWTVQMARE